MISAAQLQAQLGNCDPLPNFIGGAGDFAGAADQLKLTKSAFVMPPTESAQPNATGTQVTRQKSTIKMRVILGFIVRSATGVDQAGDVDTLREAVKTCLIGWTPNATLYSPIGLVNFQPINVSKDGMNVFYALDLYATYYVRAPQP